MGSQWAVLHQTPVLSRRWPYSFWSLRAYVRRCLVGLTLKAQIEQKASCGMLAYSNLPAELTP